MFHVQVIKVAAQENQVSGSIVQKNQRHLVSLGAFMDALFS